MRQPDLDPRQQLGDDGDQVASLPLVKNAKRVARLDPRFAQHPLAPLIPQPSETHRDRLSLHIADDQPRRFRSDQSETDRAGRDGLVEVDEQLDVVRAGAREHALAGLDLEEPQEPGLDDQTTQVLRDVVDAQDRDFHRVAERIVDTARDVVRHRSVVVVLEERADAGECVQQRDVRDRRHCHAGVAPPLLGGLDPPLDVGEAAPKLAIEIYPEQILGDLALLGVDAEHEADRAQKLGRHALGHRAAVTHRVDPRAAF